jgi:D-sedoheptulose 7-phosphate isomerase
MVILIRERTCLKNLNYISFKKAIKYGKATRMYQPSSTSSIYLSELLAAQEIFPTEDVEVVASLILENRQNGTLFVAGNGGSATTASHMVTDLGVGSQKHGIGIRAIGLTDNQGIITATANDLSYDRIFSEQLLLLGKAGDLFLAFSASGNSKNILNAFEAAKEMNIKTIAITGFDGGEMRKTADFNIHIPTSLGSYGIVEDIHSSVSHLITQLIRLNGIQD